MVLRRSGPHNRPLCSKLGAMTRQRFLGTFRLAFAVLTLAAVGVQLALGLRREDFVIANFFSFFTIESNLIGAVVFLITGFAALRARTDRFAMFRGAATLYMTTTGVIYFLLLRGLEASLQTPVPWVNTVLHYLMPLAVLADWFIAPPDRAVPLRRAWVWLLFPVAYVLYSLIRGPLVNWYPYPFLNADEQSYSQIAVTTVGMLVGMALVTALLTARTRGRV